MANIAIFRINYKSDFILTLNSDAGWMTPFCIKFWTGAPSQAYFVGFDGTTYTHCAPVDGEPTKLRVQFDDHHLPIGDLKFQIGYHFTVADFPTSVEDEVLNQASVIIEVDDAPAQVMLDLNGETAPEIEFSLPAYANEVQRIANEEERIANEEERIAHEEARIQNEETRISAEQVRQQNETQRISREQARQTNEAQRIEREQARQTNEAQRIEREQARQTNESQRIEREQARQTNEELRIEREQSRQEHEAQRISNEAERVTEFAEIKTEAVAATNEANAAASLANEKAVYAKEQGDYAKEQGDTALADHERAEADHTTAAADHTRAEVDHSTASADHTTATNDHAQAVTDHATATSDHTQAGNDHTRADQDHTRAESDHAAVEVYVDSLGAFDISAYHATGGVLAKYADLTAALGTNGANIPDTLRKGGMSVKFIQETVQSSDNKYVQYFLTKDEWSANVNDWEKINIENDLLKLETEVENAKTVLHFSPSGSTAQIKELPLGKNRKYIITIHEQWNTTSVPDSVAYFSLFYKLSGVNTFLIEIAAGYSTPYSYVTGSHYIETPNTDVDGDEYYMLVRGDSGQDIEIEIIDVTDVGVKEVYLGKTALNGYFVNSGNAFTLTNEVTYNVSAFVKLKKDSIYAFTGCTKMGGSPHFAIFNSNMAFTGVVKPIPTGNYTADRKFYYKATSDGYMLCSFHNDDLQSFRIIGLFDSDFVLDKANNLNQNLYNSDLIKKGFYIYDNSGVYTEKINDTYGITNKIWVSEGDLLYITGPTQAASSSVKDAKFYGDSTFAGFMSHMVSPYLYFVDFNGYIKLSLHNTGWETLKVIKLFGVNSQAEEPKQESDKTMLSLVEDNRTGRFDFTKVGVYDYYAAFDELAATYKDFVKQEAIGTSTTPTGDWATKDSNIYPINRYTLKKYGTSPTKRIVIEGATHGDSQYKIGNVIYNNPDDGWYNNDGDSPQNILSIYFFLADFLRNPTKNELYRNLYENYEIDIIPILNPWGVQNHSRGNGNGVDLARNFDWQWVSDTNSDGLTNGTAAFSESESSAFRDYFNSLSNVEFCIEVHARGNILVPLSVTWLIVAQDSAMISKASNIISKILCNSINGFDIDCSYISMADIANLSNWVYKVKGVESIVMEGGQSYNNDIHTRNTKMINYWMSCLLSGLVTWWANYNKVIWS